MIGNAHIDPVWIWDWREGLHEVLQTFRAALQRLAEHPDLVFTASSAVQYEWVELVDPYLFEEVQKQVAAGRWVVTGGEWVEPDCAIPSGESVCRQLLYGQRYFASRFGAPATVGYNIDSFGHAGSLPQLLAAGGITSYVMMRPNDAEKTMPGRAFRWEGVDGTSLPAYRIPYDYATSGDETSLIPERVGALLAETAAAGSVPVMAFFGVGDHGGGPTRSALAAIDSLIAEHGTAVGYSDPAQYFAAMSPHLDSLPVVRGDLHWHAVGCYSAYQRAKHANARAERALMTAEILAELCRLATGADHSVGPAIETAWKAVLFNQFHDALGGTCTRAAYESLDPMVDGALASADRLATMATHSIVQQIDTWCAGAEDAEGIESIILGMPVPLVVFNPLSWAVRSLVSIPHPLEQAEADGGAPTAVQLVPSGEVTYSQSRALVEVEVPPFGWRLYWLRLAAPEEGVDPLVSGAARHGDVGTLTNGRLAAQVDADSGALSSLVADETGTIQWIGAGGVRLVVISDESDTWSHNVERYEGEEQPFEVVSCRAVEDGPLRATYRVELRWRGSRVVEEISALRDGSFVELRFDIDWHDPLHLLKLVVPLSAELTGTTAGLPYGATVREAQGHEEVMSRFVDLAGEGGGLGITTDGLYGYDCDPSTLRLTVLRTPRYADHGEPWAPAGDFDAYPAIGLGRSTCSVRLHPHAGSFADSRLMQLAEEHVTELPHVLDTWHPGRLPRTATWLEVSPTNIVVMVLKRAEAGTGTVMRVVETAGRATQGSIMLGPDKREIPVTLRGYEVFTLFVPDDPGGDVIAIDIPELEIG